MAISTAVLILCATSWVSASSIVLTNADFELGSAATPTVDPGGSIYAGAIPGWNVVTGGGVFEPNYDSELAYSASVEATVGFFTAYTHNNTNGLVSLLLGPTITYQPDTVYTLSADFGHRLNSPFGGGFGFFRLDNPFPTAVAVTAALDPGAGNFQRQSFTLTSDQIPFGDIGDRIRIGFFGNGGQTVLDFDNVELAITSVPEPSGLLLLGFGLAAVIGRRGRA